MSRSPNAYPAQEPIIEEARLATRTSEVGSIAFHGAASAIASVRMNRAANTMERMDHKQALYSDLGESATTGKVPISEQKIADRTVIPLAPKLGENEFIASDTATDLQAKPRTIIEQLVDKRIDKKADKRMSARILEYRTDRIYGPKSELPGFTDKERKQGKMGNFSANELDPNNESTARLIRTSTKTGAQYLIGEKGIRKERREGKLTAKEARELVTKVGAQQPKHGHESYKSYGKSVRSNTRKVKHATNQQLLKKWRTVRQKRAIENIKGAYHSAQEHREKLEEIHEKRSNRSKR